MKIARHLWVGLGGLTLATLSCQLILGLEEPTGTPVTEAPPAPGEAGSDGGDPCPHSVRPPPPKKDDNPDLKNTYWFAARSVTAPLDQRAGPKGYDLDNACTCKADLHDGGPSCNAASVVCDLDRGIDDSLGAALGEFSRFPTAADAIKPVNANLQRGSRSLLVYVSEYNGLANDKSVSVAFVNAGGLYTRMGCGDSGAERPLVETYAAIPGDVHTPPGKARYAPAYDGCDRWSPEVGSFGSAGRFPSYQSSAYVTDFQLVVSVDKVTTAIFGNASAIQDALFVAKISPDGDHLKLEGILAGRMSIDDLLQAVGGTQAGNGFEDAGYPAACEQDYWPLVVPRLCAARDIMASPREDFLGRDCDAVSLNIGFTMIEAQIADFDFTNEAQKKACPKTPSCR